MFIEILLKEKLRPPRGRITARLKNEHSTMKLVY
jgi:hypothetical protein